MIDCHDIELLLAEYAAGDLPAETYRQVGDHLAGCAQCRDELELETRLRGRLASLPSPGLSAGAIRRLQRIPQAAGRRQAGDPYHRRPWLPVAGLLAAAAVLLVILLPTTAHRPVADRLAAETVSPTPSSELSPDQIAMVRREALWSVAKTVQIIDRSERSTLSEVFGRRLPQTITGSLRQALPNTQGGQG